MSSQDQISPAQWKLFCNAAYRSQRRLQKKQQMCSEYFCIPFFAQNKWWKIFLCKVLPINTIFSLPFHPITMIPECYLSAFDFLGSLHSAKRSWPCKSLHESKFLHHEHPRIIEKNLRKTQVSRDLRDQPFILMILDSVITTEMAEIPYVNSSKSRSSM